jgi:hypothetical protein
MKTLAALTLLLATSHTARAEEADVVDSARPETAESSPHPVAPRPHGKRLAIEMGALGVAGELFYFRGDGKANAFDWQLPWDMRALEAKINGSGWRFDGNAFHTNAIAHPGFGTLTYVLGRHNGYSLAKSFLISTAASVAWETFFEWAEYGSINDVLATSTAGVPIGEAAWQMATHLRQTSFQLRGGLGTQDGTTFKTLSAQAALDTSGEGISTSHGGARTSVSLEVPFDDSVRAIEGGAKTSVVGYHDNSPAKRLYAGSSAEFGYRNKEARPGSPYDVLSTVSLGPTVDITTRHGDLTLSAGADLYADFGMVKSWAFDKWRMENPMEVTRNVLRTNTPSYYYAAGASFDPRVNVAYKGAQLGGKIIASAFRSLDGADRDAEKLTVETTHTDRDVTAQAWLGYEVRGVSVLVDARLRHRDGRVNEVQDAHTEHSVIATLGYRL